MLSLACQQSELCKCMCKCVCTLVWYTPELLLYSDLCLFLFNAIGRLTKTNRRPCSILPSCRCSCATYHELLGHPPVRPLRSPPTLTALNSDVVIDMAFLCPSACPVGIDIKRAKIPIHVLHGGVLLEQLWVWNGGDGEEASAKLIIL